MKKFNLYILALVAVLGFSVSACSDDDTNVAKAVLATASGLNYSAEQPEAKIITVYSDGAWTCQHADWVMVEPDHGDGTTEVRISVQPNMRDGAPDNPRKDDVVFKGVTKASEAHVIIRQDGDKFRDVQPITISDVDALKDEEVAVLKNVTVTTVLDGGFVVTDGTNNLKVISDAAPAKGNTLSLYGERASDARNMAVLALDRYVIEGTAAVLPAPKDITAEIETYASKVREYVTMTGIVDGNNITVGEAKMSGFAVEVAKDIDWASLNGHRVKVSAFNAGTASPIVNLIINEVQDLGLVNAIFFSEDFEWLAPWSAVGNGSPAGSTVETDNPNAIAPQLGTPVVDGVSAYDALLAKSYEILATHASSKKAREPKAQTYIQTNYIKFGLTGYYSGIKMPIEYDVPAEASAELTFDWCSQRQGSGKWDPTQIVVIIAKDGEEMFFDVPVWDAADNSKYEWRKVTIQIPAGVLKKGSTITFRNCDAQWPVADSAPAMRWFLDNVKIMGK